MAPVALKIPMLEKLTLPADLLNEECTYELTSCIIHSGGEYGSGGHYTSLQKIDGIWYFFNDSISKMVSKADFKDLLQASYFLVYSKAQDIDPAARRVGADVNQQNIEAAAASKSAAVDQKKSGAENPSATDDRFALEAQQANIEILRDVKDVASHCKNREHFERYLQALPSNVLSLIMKEMDKNIYSSPEIIKMMAKDYKKEGRNLLDKDLRILAQVFHKNGGGFGDLDFSGNKELAAIYIEKNRIDIAKDLLSSQNRIDDYYVEELIFSVCSDLGMNLRYSDFSKVEYDLSILKCLIVKNRKFEKMTTSWINSEFSYNVLVDNFESVEFLLSLDIEIPASVLQLLNEGPSRRLSKKMYSILTNVVNHAK